MVEYSDYRRITCFWRVHKCYFLVRRLLFGRRFLFGVLLTYVNIVGSGGGGIHVNDRFYSVSEPSGSYYQYVLVGPRIELEGSIGGSGDMSWNTVILVDYLFLAGCIKITFWCA